MTVQYRHLPAPAAAAPVPWRLGMRRGLAGRCPACGKGALFRGYVKQHPNCPHCGLDLLAYRADDAPAYFTILFVGHILVAAMLTVEMAYHPSTTLHLVLWLPLTILLTLALLPRVKGALIGLQWALKVRS
ncbi:MAG TPA: DUF983 domain-containing protein [Stellaceae bacterium]|nr:DUF983 domain-containing protein [Stellaceae bacterium]